MEWGEEGCLQWREGGEGDFHIRKDTLDMV